MDAMRTAIKTALEGAIECEEIKTLSFLQVSMDPEVAYAQEDKEAYAQWLEAVPTAKKDVKMAPVPAPASAPVKKEVKMAPVPAPASAPVKKEVKKEVMKKDPEVAYAKKGVKKEVKKEVKAPAPAKAEKPKLRIAKAKADKAPAPAPAPALTPPSNFHITFRPGQKTPNLSLLTTEASSRTSLVQLLNKPKPSLVQENTGKSHWSVIVDVVITEGPKNGAADLVKTQKTLKKALMSDQLKDSLRGAIYEVTGDAPDVRDLDITKAMIKQWNIDMCEKHLTKMVNAFTQHYTRAQVPAALYNECTNFMPKMSFSRDHILDSGDAVRCRRP